MGCEHRIGEITVRYIPSINRILVVNDNGIKFYTNDFGIVRDYIQKQSSKRQCKIDYET
ncbi:hypothetical protein [Allomuricauda sp. AC10]|nr:hypothetical protein [Muricauda sp. AC10]MDC6367240.1 hypothetical protein [Muricauda sp. AC10]